MQYIDSVSWVPGPLDSADIQTFGCWDDYVESTAPIKEVLWVLFNQATKENEHSSLHLLLFRI